MRHLTNVTLGQAFLLALISSTSLRAAAGQDWSVYLGDSASSQYSELQQINTSNVNRLAVAWTYRTGDLEGGARSQIQCNPLIVEGVLYGTSPRLKVFAVDAATGQQLWIFDPFSQLGQDDGPGINRGLVYWKEGHDGRLFFSAGHYLYALQASTGKVVAEFGKGGRVDLRDDLGRDASKLYVQSRTPGAVYRDLVIWGTVVSEGPGPSAPGHIRAYDVRTGKLKWIFHTIPHPGEFGYETWPADAWKHIGGANSWAGMTIDHKRGLTFIPTGSPAFDFWGGNRIGANLFGNCLLVLDAATGKRRWHFQFVHHDIWDRDLPAPPNLVEVVHGGKSIDAVAQITKSGHVFLFERETGRPLFPIEERTVPQSDLQAEKTSATQPFPTKPLPFARQTFTESEATDLSQESRAHVLERLKNLRTGKPFLPPSQQGTVIFPGFDGGGEWGGAAFDPHSRVLYVNANEMPWILTMVEARPRDRASATPGGLIYSQHCATCHGADRKGDPQLVYPSLVKVAEKLSPEAIMQLLETGRGFMPSYRFLSDDEKRSLTAFLLGTEKQRGEGDGSLQTPAAFESPFTHTGYNRFLDPDGYPAVKPPWGTLNAINLDTGEYEWKIPLGELPELKARGIPATGTENYGGPIVTAGGLIFIGATKDEKFRAFDKKNGNLLWEFQLPAGGYATPSTYMVKGKQFVVIAAGGGKMGTKSGDSYVCFTLPDQP
ncbi:MAG: PQQ-binding-like beta-propeller repeat protein [Acidobacteriota bacterium]